MKSNITPTQKELGKRIKAERERLNLTQVDFGSINNLSSRTIIKWENAQTFPNLLQLSKLREHGLNIDALFDKKTDL